MKKLKTVTFTGIDEMTDIERLVDIQNRYPYAEFGLLMSMNWAENGNRYPNPDILDRLCGRGLHLSLHLCGRLSRKSFIGNWSDLSEICQVNEEKVEMFDRIQLNVAHQSVDGLIKTDGCPFDVKQFIIQQRSADDCELYKLNEGNELTAMLCDMSGGRGLFDIAFLPYVGEKGKMVGYAGGLDEDNVVFRLYQIEESEPENDYWVDMESSLRRNEKDLFDLDTVERILEKIDKWVKNYG